jgi:serine/threonine-protein kinase PRP4
VSSDSEAKANTSRSSRNDTSVDRHTRLYPAPRSPTARDRPSRSRSPHRASRGEKRRRDDEHPRDRPRQDPRTFHVRYEDDHHIQRRHDPYDRRDWKRPRTYSRSRSRSRSPYRHWRAKEEDRERQRPGRKERDRGTRANTEEVAASDNVTENYRPTTTRNSAHSKNPAESGSTAQPLSVRLVEPPKVTRLTDTSSRDPELASRDDPSEKSVRDEAALIEERRKRREAIKNKYRGQATPLLVQALHLGADSSRTTPGLESSPASPGPYATDSPVHHVKDSGTREGSPVASSPQTSQPSDPQSPAVLDFANDESLANGDAGSPAEDEPSAADYDPTIDMQEERARHAKRLFKEDEQSLTTTEKQVTGNAEDKSAETGKSKKTDFDMFAEDDDDDDMFAEVPIKPKAEIKTAQALDVRMMDNWDDPEGYYITISGELIDDRYQVTQNLGRGMFSSVVRGEDSKSKQAVAIKIVRNNESMKRAGIKEIEILKDLAANDPDDRKHVIRLLRSFDHKGHLCMVFENLSLNLREVLKKFGRDIGINLKAIRAYSQQLFLGLSLLKKCQYLHADLKPDNILVNEARNAVKICDLGSASPITENATAPYLVSRFYRAPEVILGIPYDYGIDMWSVACTLFELYTGKILFTGRNNNNMLRTIMECRGKFPHKLLRRGTLAHEYFDDLLNFRAQEMDKTTGRIITKLIDVKAKPVRDLRSRLVPKGKRLEEQERKEMELFLDLLDKCLDLRPDKRITPVEALKHPFLVRVKA